MNQTKMTVKIYEPLFKSFDDQMNRLCIKRDAFLNHMIKRETPNLAKELDGRRLSPSARRYISGSLKRMGTRTVNVVVDKETAEALNAVVDASNIVRDAFINRLIMFLRSSCGSGPRQSFQQDGGTGMKAITVHRLLRTRFPCCSIHCAAPAMNSILLRFGQDRASTAPLKTASEIWQ